MIILLIACCCHVGHVVPTSCVPSEIPNFYGRQEECEEILCHLAGSKNTRLVDICGPPGFGKTSLATTIANRLHENSVSVYFVNLRGMESKDDLVEKLLLFFKDVKDIPRDISRPNVLIQCLQQLQRSVVLILDNADDLLELPGDTTVKEEVLRLSKEILDQCCHIKLLFTTREELDFLTHEVPIHLEKIGELDKNSSAMLVKSLLPNVSEDECSLILKECYKVPLAIRLMCSIIKNGNVLLDDLLEELKKSTLVEVLDDDRLPHDQRIRFLINKSFQRLSPELREAFVSLAIYPDSFDVEDTKLALGLDEASERIISNLLRNLEAKSLIERDRFGSFIIHSLLRGFIHDKKLSDDETRTTFDKAIRRHGDVWESYRMKHVRIVVMIGRLGSPITP